MNTYEQYDLKSQAPKNLINSWNAIQEVLAANFSLADKCDKEPSFGI